MSATTQGRPGCGHIAGPASVSGGEVVAAMDAVGVDGAILVSPLSLYRYDVAGDIPAPVILFTVAQSVKFLVYSHRCGHWGRDPSLGYSPQVWRHQTFW
jgi:hypothetical protein